MKKTLTVCAALALSACQQERSPSGTDVDLTAKDASIETCSACGMVIREQPAPRGQVIHRDGSREFMCSISDLLRYLDVPSPKGKPKKVYAEVMADDHIPVDMDRAAKPWSEAVGLFFVIGINRKGVMGKPALTYRTRTAADKAAKKFGGRVVSFDQLRIENRK